MSEDFTTRQLLWRLAFYKFKFRKGLINCPKITLLEIIESIETLATREIEDTED